MKAIVYTEYGSPDVLRIEEIEKPTPGDNEVRIELRAASVNPFDWHFMRGAPYMVRLAGGLRKPKRTRLGVDAAGLVDAVGKNVTQFKPGDEVFGFCRGAFAEYVCTLESKVIAKPRNATFEQAAAVPLAGCTALQSLRDNGKIQAGQKVLINGAAGGVGTFAVQIAKALGAEVTGVCGANHVETVRSLGADRVIDYTREDFTKSGERYDLMLDVAGNRSLSECRRVLKPRATYVVVGGPNRGRWVGPLSRSLTAALMSRFVSQTMLMMLAKGSKHDLTFLRDLIEQGKVNPVIDRRYTLNETAEAVRYVEEGHAGGKVVIVI